MIFLQRARRAIVVLLATAALVGSTVAPVVALDDGVDANISGEEWGCVRHDGGTDAAIDHCNDTGSSDVPDTDGEDGDTDVNDGGSARQANEPFVIFDPSDPDTLVAGWNDYGQTDLGAGWQGFAYSRDGGDTWWKSFVPGYPLDDSPEGEASPLHGRNTEAGDPIAAFDNDGNLYVGGISFSRAGAINGHVYVARYGAADVAIGGGADDYPVDYEFTRIVGIGTPSRNFQGIFQDKPILEVDRTGGDTDGNVYVCWSRFTGFGQNKIFFSRSTDGGDTWSRPFQLSVHGFTGSVQGCDIAVEGDGDVYVTFRTFNDPSTVGENALYFVRSTNGGASFSKAKWIRDIVPYAPRDPRRDCGDGAFECTQEYVFARVPLEPRVTADQSSASNGVWLVYNEVAPTTIEDADTSFNSAGPGEVGRSVVYVVKSTNNGASWSAPISVDLDAGGDFKGHQFFPDIDALGEVLAVVWQDSRTDDCYSLQRPMGNTEEATACPDDNVVNTFVATSDDGGATWDSIQVSDEGHQPQYEMFGNRQIPFQGDYNWVSIVDANGAAAGGLWAYVAWTDNRDVVPGVDPRESGAPDGFDVEQCRVLVDDVWGADRCPNAGGLDQNIYGDLVSVP